MKNKEEQARLDGMSYALQIAKEKGIDELERVCKFYGATNFSTKIPKSVITEVGDEIRKIIAHFYTVMTMATLHDEFDFGKSRLERFQRRFDMKAEGIAIDEVLLSDYEQVLRDECGIEVVSRD